MNKIVNTIRGNAKIEIYGDYPEQYINALAKKGLPFWNFRKYGNGKASLYVPLSYLNDAQRAGKGLDCELQVAKKTGLTYFLYGLRRRWALILGFFLCFVAVSILSLFVWEIDVTGNETVSTGEILTVLDNLGVHIGTFSLSIDQQDIRSRALYELKDLSWLTVNIVGTRAEVIVRERIKKPDIIDVKKPAEIVAEKSGVISKLKIYQGQPAVNVGQTVSKGDVLVGSRMESLNSGERRVHAMGEIYARTWYEFSYEMPLEYTAKMYTGKKSQKNAILLFGKRINLYFTTGLSDTFCDKIIKNEKLVLPGGYTLPITVYTEKDVWYLPSPAKIDKDEAVGILKDRLTEKLDSLIGDGEKVSVNFETAETDGAVKVTLKAECLEQIGKIQETD